jgi:hypothetical protein
MVDFFHMDSALRRIPSVWISIYHQLYNRIQLVYWFYVCCCDQFGFACSLQFVSSQL